MAMLRATCCLLIFGLCAVAAAELVGECDYAAESGLEAVSKSCLSLVQLKASLVRPPQVADSASSRLKTAVAAAQTGQKQVPDLSDAFGQINETADMVVEVVGLVNSTIGDVVGSVMSAVEDFNKSAGEVKSSADAGRALMGDEVADWAATFLDKVMGVASKMQSTLDKLSKSVLSPLAKAADKFSGQRDKLLSQFQQATAALTAAEDAQKLASQLSLLQMIRQRFDQFSGAAKSDCGTAASLTKAANKTIGKMVDMLSKFNDTAASSLVEKVVGTAESAMGMLNSTVQKGLDAAGDKLPGTIKDTVLKEVGKVFGVVDEVKSNVQDAVGTIMGKISDGKTSLTLLYLTSNMLAAQQEQTCSSD